MSFYDWIYSNYAPNAQTVEINTRYGLLHILSVALAILACVGISFLRKRDERTRKTVIYAVAGAILLLELARRIINFTRGGIYFQLALYMLLPRPWCAIACWCFIACVFVNKKFFYNFTTMIALVCTTVFIVHPNVGFDGQMLLFENIYSICTHLFLFVGAISLITLGFTDFTYVREPKCIKKSAIWELVCLATMYAYAFFEALALKIEKDPLMFMRDNDVQKVLSTSYGAYLVIYVLFLAFYFNAFYLVTMLVRYLRARKTNKLTE